MIDDREVLESALDVLTADDGFYITRTQVGQRLALYLGFMWEGQPVCLPGVATTLNNDPTLCLRVWENYNSLDWGECDRLEAMMVAFCRYLNTGGKIDDLQQLLTFAGIAIKDVSLEVAFNGRQLVSSVYAAKFSKWRHIFAREDSHLAVDWMENRSITIIEPRDTPKHGLVPDASAGVAMAD